MYAIVSIAGQQFKVEKGKKIFVHKLPGVAGDEVSFDKVMLIGNEEKISVGAPYLPEAAVIAQIVSQLKGEKVLVFKKKRRKGYQKLNGHRQYLTEILIEDIAESGTRGTVKRKVTEPEKDTSAEVTAPELKAEKPKARKASSAKAAPKVDSEEKVKKAPVKKASVAASGKKPAVKKKVAPKAENKK